MPTTEIDRLWFRAHPDRAYRLRRMTPAELQGWLVMPRPGFTAWCIIREEDGAVEEFARADSDAQDDFDLELEQFFNEMRRAPA